MKILKKLSKKFKTLMNKLNRIMNNVKIQMNKKLKFKNKESNSNFKMQLIKKKLVSWNKNLNNY